jgi:hypothetical protein
MLHFRIYTLLTYFVFKSGFSSTDYIASDSRMINEWWVTKNMERGGHVVICSNILAFAWRDWEKTWQTSVGVVGVLAETQTRNLPKSGYDYYWLSQFDPSFTCWIEIWMSLEQWKCKVLWTCLCSVSVFSCTTVSQWDCAGNYILESKDKMYWHLI